MSASNRGLPGVANAGMRDDADADADDLFSGELGARPSNDRAPSAQYVKPARAMQVCFVRKDQILACASARDVVVAYHDIRSWAHLQSRLRTSLEKGGGIH